MLTDFKIDGDEWIKKNIIPECQKDVRFEYVDGGIAIYMKYDHPEEGRREFMVHGCFKSGFPTGIYEADVNFDNVIADFFGDGRWSHREYGLCDNYQQVLKRYARSRFIKGKEKYCLLLTPIYRKDEPPVGGFRYHKWGEYIGTQNPQNEYLYDDRHIDMVYAFHFVKCG